MRMTSQLDWTYGRFTGFDLETTSTDPQEARIVTGSVVQYGGGRPTTALTRVSDVRGAEVPPPPRPVARVFGAPLAGVGRPHLQKRR